MWKFKDSLKIAFKLDMAAKTEMILPAVGYNVQSQVGSTCLNEYASSYWM